MGLKMFLAILGGAWGYLIGQHYEKEGRAASAALGSAEGAHVRVDALERKVYGEVTYGGEVGPDAAISGRVEPTEEKKGAKPDGKA